MYGCHWQSLCLTTVFFDKFKDKNRLLGKIRMFLHMYPKIFDCFLSLDALILGKEPDVSQETERNMRLKADIAELIDKLTQLKCMYAPLRFIS